MTSINTRVINDTLPLQPQLNQSSIATSPTEKGKPYQDVLNLKEKQKNIIPKDNSVRFLFFSDAHSRSTELTNFINIANKVKPDLIIDGGDMVHDGTEAELLEAYEQRDKFNSPLYIANGNHDEHIRGPFKNPPPHVPSYQSLEVNGTHFILLDNEDETLTEEQFTRLENELKTLADKPVVLAMHVPAKLSHTSWASKLKNVLPFKLANSTMNDKAQVSRFMNMMSKYNVDLVLAGHTHKGDQFSHGGVTYAIAGATGGLTPGLGIERNYFDITIDNGQVDLKSVELSPGTKNPLKYAGEVLTFYQDLNQFNHRELGWSYTPSVSLKYQSGLKITTKDGESHAALNVGTQFERELSEKQAMFFSAGGAVGSHELSTNLGIGYKYRLIGDYNKSWHINGAVGVNGGMINRSLSGGAGVKIGTGIEMKNATLDLGYEWATNMKAVTASVGYRF